MDGRTDLFVQLTCLVHLWFLDDMGLTSLTVAHSPFETPADLQAAQGSSEGPRATILCSNNEWKNIPSTCRLLQSVKVQILYQRLNTCRVLLLQNIVCVKIKDQLVALSVVWGFYPNSQTPFNSPQVFTSPRPSPGKRLPCTHLWRSRTFSRVRKIKWLFSGSMVYDVSSKLLRVPPHRQKRRWKNQNRSHRSILFKKSWQVA